MALARLKDSTVDGYLQKVNKYLEYCSTLGIDPFKTESVERYIFFMWNSGFKKQSPESFRSAFKKYCVIANRDHPFKEKSKSEKVPRFISLSDFVNISEVVSLSNNPIWTDLFELARVSVWQNIRVSTLLKIKYNDIFRLVASTLNKSKDIKIQYGLFFTQLQKESSSTECTVSGVNPIRS